MDCGINHSPIKSGYVKPNEHVFSRDAMDEWAACNDYKCVMRVTNNLDPIIYVNK